MTICNWSGIINILEKIYHLTIVRSRRWKIDPNEIVGDHTLNHKCVANYVLDPSIWNNRTTEAEVLCNWIRSSESLPEISNKNSAELQSKQQVKQQVKFGGFRPERGTRYTSAERDHESVTARIETNKPTHGSFLIVVTLRASPYADYYTPPVQQAAGQVKLGWRRRNWSRRKRGFSIIVKVPFQSS